MKKLRLITTLLVLGVLFVSCDENTLHEPPLEEFTIPVIPAYILEEMYDEDIARFKAGPLETHLAATRGMPNDGRKWRPVIMSMGYQLQIGPIGGQSCATGDFMPCFGLNSSESPSTCLANLVGAAGVTKSEAFDGVTFNLFVRSEYYPVFCLPDYTGYGRGFYEVDGDMLVIEGESTAFEYDVEGNAMFYRNSQYVGEESTGRFADALGWETMISVTSPENSPSNHPQGKGYSEVVIFGWLYW